LSDLGVIVGYGLIGLGLVKCICESLYRSEIGIEFFELIYALACMIWFCENWWYVDLFYRSFML